MGARYRLHLRLVGRITADIVFKRQRVAIFVDGCFWHGCPDHGRREFHGPNAPTWEGKLEQNRIRDAKATDLLGDRGWYVMRIWECAINESVIEVANRVIGTVKDRTRTEETIR